MKNTHAVDCRNTAQIVAKKSEAVSDLVLEVSVAEGGRLRLKCDGTRAETRFRLSAKTDESI